MHSDFYAFGEILWDCLPAARHAGGAPFNVAVHLAQLGAAAALISAIGADALGDEILQLARAKGVDTAFVRWALGGLNTGTVLVALDANANASYQIVQPAAWDEIEVSPSALEAVAQSRALVFGSLALRSPHNCEQLEALLALPGPTKFFDVNLRAPFFELPLIIALARRADVVKLNDDELGLLVGCLENQTPATPRDDDALAKSCAIFARATGAARVCVTRGAAGAALWENGALVGASAPSVVVQDTIGAGDAFMAALMLGLTRGQEAQVVLENACDLGAYVASQPGATPALPPEIARPFQVRP